MLFNRESGILLHLTSLPGKYGMGEIGVETLQFLDFLKETNQSLWQILPIGPTGYADSPYQCHSSFACNPLVISLESLREVNLLTNGDLESAPDFPNNQVDFGSALTWRRAMLRKAARNLLEDRSHPLIKQLDGYKMKNAYWLNEYALYQSIKETQELQSWITWPERLRDRDKAALAEFSETHSFQIESIKALQFLFELQWAAVRTKAKELGIKIIGDLPIVVAHDSADVWANRHLFKLDAEGNPTFVAGVPPDLFSATGQRWGNPLFNWEEHKKEGYDWWLKRLTRVLELTDIVRIDHFRGFQALYEIPATCSTAEEGEWVDAPGREILNKVKETFGDLPIIAEDLGHITDDVHQLRDDFNLPGLRLLLFAFGEDPESDTFHPNNYHENCVAYTGTHDNNTVIGTIRSEARETSGEQKQALLDYVGGDSEDLHWKFIDVLLESKAGATIIPMQDFLGLGAEARMNNPARESGDWVWRFTWDQVNDEIKRRLAANTERFGRKH